MQDHWIFVVLCGVSTMLLSETYGSKEQAECKDKNNFSDQVLEKCCNIPDDELLNEEDKVVGAMCDKMVYGVRPPPSTEEERLKLFECLDECFYNATGLLTADMKLNETALLAEYEVKSYPIFENHPYWKEPLAKAVKICIGKNVTSEVKPDAKCKSGSFQFSQCFGLNLYMNCPEEVWNIEDKECEKIRGIIKNC